MQSDLAQLVEPIAAEAAQRAVEVDRGTFPAETLRRLGEAGLLGLTSSPEVGGMGQGLKAAAYLVGRLARECGSTAMIVCMHLSATSVVEKYGPREIREAIAAGRHLTTFAFSEVGSRSQFWVPVSTATLDGSEVRLNARKSFITAARHADSYVWVSKPLAGDQLATLWLVPRTTPGIRHGEPFDGLGLRGNDSSGLTAEDARIPVTARLGEDGVGFNIIMDLTLIWFNLLATAVSVGLMESAVAKATAHVAGSKFQHSGTSIADLPTVRAYVARMQIGTDQAKTLLADAIAAVETGRPDAMLRVLESKAAAGEAAATVTDLAMRVCGGVAFRKEIGVERVFRDARAAQVMGPTTDFLYDCIGKVMCGLPLFP
jgi:alkylation response protein AidB-like acyl-CoA dehydrogenase